MSGAKFDPTKPVQTRDGRKARIIATDRAGTYPIIALVFGHKGTEIVCSFTVEGCFSDCGTGSSSDLVNVPPSLWQNVYRSTTGAVHQTRGDAEGQNGAEGRIAVLEIPPVGLPIVHAVGVAS